MNDNFGKCDLMLLFCSQNALQSQPVNDEWMAAKALNKPIIPVFTTIKYISAFNETIPWCGIWFFKSSKKYSSDLWLGFEKAEN